MNDIEAFLILLSYLLPFGGITNLIVGISEKNILRIVVGIVCVIIAIFIMGILIYNAKKEKRLLKYNERKIKLLLGMFRHIIISCILMIVEFLILWHFGIEIRQTIPIICISLVIMTIIFKMFNKI